MEWGDNYIQKAIAQMEKVEKGLLSPDEAAANILNIINSTSWLFKASGLADPSKHFADLQTSKRFHLSFVAYSL
ncbi:hypothetical protein IQ238_21695 [Pleurocapsales cyanobacterium LEGE 06147]|nr:hypothetical protein [Pleurocapsales cyanobacterium LEGE 06147]